MNNLLPVLEQALSEAAAIQKRHYGRLESIEHKGEINLVTIADRQCEARIKEIISSNFPGHQILAEESGADYEGKSDAYRWIIDPLDGTTNFSHSFPQFSVSIAVEHRGKIVAAGVHDTMRAERFLAERGSGATLNGAPIRVSSVKRLADSLLVTGFPYDRREKVEHYLEVWGQFIRRAHGILRLGSAALDLCYVACGRLECFWEEKLFPWDSAAGWLIVEEAGGKLTDFAGAPFSPYGKELLATNGAIHQECLEVLSPYHV